MLYRGQGSYGTTAAVRATPVGLVPHVGLSALADLARRSAMITHSHPIGRDAAAAQATAVALAARNHPSSGLNTVRFIDTVLSHVQSTELRAALRTAATLLRHRAGAVEAAATLSNRPTALRAVPAALLAYLRYPDQPLSALHYALLIGGQTRQIAAMTAAMSGARSMHFTIPASWRPALLGAGAVRTAAQQLSTVGFPSSGP
jgi:poly(ADP-ribose) glycohydrolase ARH3